MGSEMCIRDSPQLAVGREMTHTSWSLAERIPEMYTIPATDVMYEQSESALVEQGRVLVSDDSVRSRHPRGQRRLSPNQDGIFYRATPC